MHKTNLLNRKAVRSKALATLAHRRPHLAAKFTRVSSDFFQAVEGALIVAIENRIQSMPTCGKTIK